MIVVHLPTFLFSLMDLYLEPLMTGLPKLSCYHRAYFDGNRFVVDLGSTIFNKGHQVFSKEIISGTEAIRPEIRFIIDEEINPESENDKDLEEGKTYKVKQGNKFVASRTKVDHSILTNYVRFSVLTNNRTTQHKDGSSIINVKGTGTRVSDKDLFKVVSLIHECLEWRNIHHVTVWKDKQ